MFSKNFPVFSSGGFARKYRKQQKKLLLQSFTHFSLQNFAPCYLLPVCSIGPFQETLGGHFYSGRWLNFRLSKDLAAQKPPKKIWKIPHFQKASVFCRCFHGSYDFGGLPFLFNRWTIKRKFIWFFPVTFFKFSWWKFTGNHLWRDFRSSRALLKAICVDVLF